MFVTLDAKRAHEVAASLREADRCIARALDLLCSTDVQTETGLSTETFLALEADWTGPDARFLAKAAAALRAMPLTRSAFLKGRLSWSQVRAIVCSVRHLDVLGRAAVDALVHEHAGTDDEPDNLIARIDEEVAAIRADLATAREDRAIERSFLAVQSRLDGGATFYGEADTESAATILEALEAASEQPVDPAREEAPSRAKQRMDAFVRVCESYLSGGQGGRPRPRILATIDVDAFAKKGRTDSARVLSALVGRPGLVTPLATETMLCDASIVPVIFDGARPVAVGDATSPISTTMRTALAARDGGCRFPGCGAGVSWCDAHHIRARADAGPTQVDNLILLCRQCHRTVHRFRWRISMRDNGTINFSRRGRTYSSTPRARMIPSIPERNSG
jgi:5-methylcytosine-specific restriction protein A